jgi:hypothetical protein
MTVVAAAILHSLIRYLLTADCGDADPATSYLHVPAPGAVISFSGYSRYAFMHPHHIKQFNILATCCQPQEKESAGLRTRTRCPREGPGLWASGVVWM